MIRFRSLILSLGLLGLFAAPALASGYFGLVPDLPLMDGLEERGDLGAVFDKPEGRIVDAYAEGVIAPQAIVGFYSETLPQLGWRALDSGLEPSASGSRHIWFERDQEVLEIMVSSVSGGATRLHIHIFPTPPS